MNQFLPRRCWAEVDLTALRGNLSWLRHRVGKAIRILTVVKADAYGHGLKQIAAVLMQSGTDMFGVASLAEARVLRSVGRGWLRRGRLGLGRGFRVLARSLHVSVPERYIDWEDVDPVESSIASIKLRVPHQGLAELHPADLAAILDRLAPRDRAGVLASLDDEAVADAMEEMEPDTQVEVLEDLAPERAADILEEMSPDDAADLVADLDQDTRDDILRYMEPSEAQEVQELLAYPEDTAGGIMTTAYIAVGEHVTAGGAIDLLREWEPDAETIYYVYVTDDDDRLVGVLSLRDLIVAPPSTVVADVMIREPVAVGAFADEDEVAEVVAHYNLLAVPVVDGEGRLVGIVTIDDAIDTVIPAAWKKRLPRVFGRR